MGSTELVTLVMTEACNLRCKYCYVNHRDVTNNKVTPDVIDATLRLVDERMLARPYNQLFIEVFGGEPLLVMDEVKYLIEESKWLYEKHGNKFHILIFTNATLITEEFMIYTKQFPYVGWNVSLDGDEKSHNLARQYMNGKGSYIDTVRGFDIYDNIYNNEYIRHGMYVLSPDNIREHLNAINNMKENGITLISTCLARDDIWSEDDLREYKKAIEGSVDFYIEEYPKCGIMNLLLLHPIYRINNPDNSMYCGIGNHFIGIAPNGDIYPCHKIYNLRIPEYKMGTVFDGIDELSPIYNVFKNIGANYIKECNNCKYGLKDICGGQCVASCLESNGSAFKPIDSVCRLQKITFDASMRLDAALITNPEYQELCRRFIYLRR